MAFAWTAASNDMGALSQVKVLIPGPGGGLRTTLRESRHLVDLSPRRFVPAEAGEYRTARSGGQPRKPDPAPDATLACVRLHAEHNKEL